MTIMNMCIDILMSVIQTDMNWYFVNLTAFSMMLKDGYKTASNVTRMKETIGTRPTATYTADYTWSVHLRG